MCTHCCRVFDELFPFEDLRVEGGREGGRREAGREREREGGRERESELAHKRESTRARTRD